ncbi:hypothetical protein ABW21_db0203941 [Orbilia brochopaga]|nr:hypothetical protein ABW21_db0203941 [Drechslerella brochopaga]
MPPPISLIRPLMTFWSTSWVKACAIFSEAGWLRSRVPAYGCEEGKSCLYRSYPMLTTPPPLPRTSMMRRSMLRRLASVKNISTAACTACGVNWAVGSSAEKPVMSIMAVLLSLLS